MLLFDLHQLQRIAIPLDYVDRLEMFDVSAITLHGSQDVILYGDEVLQLVWLCEHVEGVQAKHFLTGQKVPVVVHHHAGQAMGLVVQRIHEIVTVPSDIVLLTPPQRGFLGTAIVDDQVVSILDVPDILALHHSAPARVHEVHTIASEPHMDSVEAWR